MSDVTNLRGPGSFSGTEAQAGPRDQVSPRSFRTAFGSRSPREYGATGLSMLANNSSREHHAVPTKLHLGILDGLHVALPTELPRRLFRGYQDTLAVDEGLLPLILALLNLVVADLPALRGGLLDEAPFGKSPFVLGLAVGS